MHSVSCSLCRVEEENLIIYSSVVALPFRSRVGLPPGTVLVRKQTPLSSLPLTNPHLHFQIKHKRTSFILQTIDVSV
ncbi:hypothetical protein L2E82_08275 [Cichorium intybus]|uniref:Uncharacterized protein n=1 Tax=Cichorium intybus TaxID=13427 RepID=A0ACB9G774_CICIN|nr:hypothetical protein L2E82_08275 [Cichorium intybus]